MTDDIDDDGDNFDNDDDDDFANDDWHTNFEEKLHVTLYKDTELYRRWKEKREADRSPRSMKVTR
jgi:hypothetical protein